MPRMQFEMSTWIYGRWWNVIKQTVKRLSANGVSRLHLLASLSNTATATSAALSHLRQLSAHVQFSLNTDHCNKQNELRCKAARSESHSWRHLLKAEGCAMFQAHIYDYDRSEVCRWKMLPSHLQFGWQEKGKKMLQKRWHPSTLNTVKLSFSKVSVPEHPENALLVQKSANITTHTATPKEVSELLCNVSGVMEGVWRKNKMMKELPKHNRRHTVTLWNHLLETTRFQTTVQTFHIYLYKKEKKNHCNHYVSVCTFPAGLE